MRMMMMRHWWSHRRTAGRNNTAASASRTTVRWWRVGEELMWSLGLRQRILGGEEALGFRAVSFTFCVLLKSVGDGDRTVAQVLAIHGLEGCVRRLEAGEVDERKTLRAVRVVIAHYLSKTTRKDVKQLHFAKAKKTTTKNKKKSIPLGLAR